jgi:hypothetical protein
MEYKETRGQDSLAKHHGIETGYAKYVQDMGIKR